MSPGTICEYTASFGFTSTKILPACSGVVWCATIPCTRSALMAGFLKRNASGSITS